MKKRTLNLYIMLVFIIPLISLAQEWVARYNGPGSSGDGAYAIAVDNEGNVHVTGYSEGSGTWGDYATVKYNTSGVEQWVARYNGLGNDWDVAYAIALDGAGNVHVTGYSTTGPETDYATVKYDASGVEQWVARYNGPGNGGDGASAIAVDNSGNVYVTGNSEGSGTGGDYATVKYDASGVEQWVARYNGPGNSGDGASAIAVDNSGNVCVTGYSEGSGTARDYATVKYDASGVEQWVARYNGPGNDWDEARAIAVDNEGNIYVTGRSYGSGTARDYATVKYNASGVEQWVARYNGPGNDNDRADAIAVDNEGNIYVTGGSDGLGTAADFATVKYNASGVEQWVRRYNGPVSDNDRARAIGIEGAGNIYVTGYSIGSGTQSDYATMKYSASGEWQWVARYDGPGNSGDGAYAIDFDGAGNVYITGYSEGSGTGGDYATIKYSSPGIEERRIISVGNNYLGATIFSGPLLLPEGKNCKVFDITGRVVKPSTITRGIYFIEIDGVVTQKVVKVR